MVLCAQACPAQIHVWHFPLSSIIHVMCIVCSGSVDVVSCYQVGNQNPHLSTLGNVGHLFVAPNEHLHPPTQLPPSSHFTQNTCSFFVAFPVACVPSDLALLYQAHLPLDQGLSQQLSRMVQKWSCFVPAQFPPYCT